MSDKEKTFIVEEEFKHRGLKCAILLLSIGHRCGYVGINGKHPLFGIKYI